jgi:hypothetical protein
LVCHQIVWERMAGKGEAKTKLKLRSLLSPQQAICSRQTLSEPHGPHFQLVKFFFWSAGKTCDLLLVDMMSKMLACHFFWCWGQNSGPHTC